MESQPSIAVISHVPLSFDLTSLSAYKRDPYLCSQPSGFLYVSGLSIVLEGPFA